MFLYNLSSFTNNFTENNHHKQEHVIKGAVQFKIFDTRKCQNKSPALTV